MSQDTLESSYIVQRNKVERRATVCSHPPYLTEEGMVLVDRRENHDRRSSEGQAANSAYSEWIVG
jgi:hypothetical protein